MNKIISYIVASIVCICLVILYFIIATFLGWERGGGNIPLLMLFSVLAAVWKAIISFSDKRNKKEEKDIDTSND